MKAAILAGGFGTRLRPLTHHVPKPLIPLVGKPLIRHIIDSLPDQVDTVILAVNYMKEALGEYFSEVDLGREIVLVEEAKPLGTGGALRNLMEYLDDTFLVFNGDVISSIDLQDLLIYHETKGGIGTIALWRVEDPTAFGVVSTDSSGRITLFQEKPAPGEAVSDLINAGIYIFEPELLQNIAEGEVSLEREVFPKILDLGLYGYRFEGYWVDCGTRENLLRAQRILLDIGGDFRERCQIADGASINPPNYLSGTTLENCCVGPYVAAYHEVMVKEGASLSNCILMPGANIGRGAVIQDSIVCPSTRVKGGMEVCGRIYG